MKDKSYLIPTVCFIALIILGVGTLNGWFWKVNTSIYSFFAGIQNPSAYLLFSIITLLFNTLTFVVLSVVLIGYLFYKKRKNDLIFSFIVLAGGSVLAYLTKFAFAEERPIGYFIQETGYSFPSGHAVKSVLFLMVLFILFRQKIKSLPKRKIFVAVLVVITALVCLSRLYLGVHWLIDILAGIVFATGWVGLIYLLANEGK